MGTLLCVGRVVLPDRTVAPGHILIERGAIASVGADWPKSSSVQSLNFPDLTLAPGLIDTHIHGWAGNDAMGGARSLTGMSQQLAAQAVTSFMPTLVAAPPADLVSAVRSAGGASLPGARMIGLRLEGPYLDRRAPGMFGGDEFRPFDVEEITRLQDVADGLIRVVDVDVAAVDAGAVEVLASLGSIGSLAHSLGTYEDGLRVVARGIGRCTHLFNAMGKFSQRQPGLIGAMLDSGVHCELIADGVHVHPAIARLAFARIGVRRLVLISDATPVAGCGDGQHQWGGREIIVGAGRAQTADGRIAGSVSPLLADLRWAVGELGVALHDGFAMATATALDSIGMGAGPTSGGLTVGGPADCILLTDDLAARATLVDGRTVWRDPSLASVDLPAN